MGSRIEDLDVEWRGAIAEQRIPLRVAILCSHRAPGLSYLLEEDANRGPLYDVICCLTTEETFADDAVVTSHGIPLIVHPIRRFCQERGSRVTDLTARSVYDAVTVERLQAYRPTLVVLDSYLYLLTQPVLAAFPQQIINVHHSDLTRRDETGRARYTGLRAVRDAIVAGERATRATVHLVTAELDEGPALLRSWAFPVSPLAVDAITRGAIDVLKAYVFAHQEWMIRSAWGPLLAEAFELIATGRVDLSATAATSPELLMKPPDLEGIATPCRDRRIPGRSPHSLENH